MAALQRHFPPHLRGKIRDNYHGREPAAGKVYARPAGAAYNVHSYFIITGRKVQGQTTIYMANALRLVDGRRYE
eukprot:4069552-Prorocentrum_lima.AAC.1